MKTINNRDELLNLVKLNFAYLIADNFQILDVEIPNSTSWAVTLEGECRLRIEWNGHDGVFIYASKSGKPDPKIPHGYVIEILVYYLMGKQIVEQYFDDTNMNNGLENIKPYSLFLQTHLDKIIEFVSSSQFELQTPRIQQARQALLDLQIQRIKEGRFWGANK